MSLTQSAILLIARRAASLCGLLTGGGVCTVAALFTVCLTSLAWISRGCKLLIGRFVVPLAVRTFAERTSPSWPLLMDVTSASFQFTLGLSSWMRTTSPTLTDSVLTPDLLWNSRREVRYSWRQRCQKCWISKATRFAFLRKSAFDW